MTPDGLDPPPTPAGRRTVVAAQFVRLEGAMTFDVVTRRAAAAVSVTLHVGADGCAAFDLRQPIASATLDGRAWPPARLAHHDLGGGPGAEMRVIDEPWSAGAGHTLELEYELGTPDVPEPRPVAWGDGKVDFDVWCSDLYPARYLEQWLPVGLCQDRFALSLDVAVVGATSEHTIVANASVTATGDNRWQLNWPEHHTSLSSLLLVAPTCALRRAGTTAAGVGVDLTAAPGVDGEVEQLAENVAAWLDAYAARFGPYGHGARFVAHAWDSTRGMEYDGATTASVHALEHEVVHSWFGRGVKPATASDGWIDEAVVTWVTSDSADFPRLGAVTFTLDEEPVVLAPPSPWSRCTPREAYRTGYRILAGLAAAAGGPDPVLDALAACYRVHAGGHLTTAGLAGELSESLGVDVGPWWDRYVHGRA